MAGARVAHAGRRHGASRWPRRTAWPGACPNTRFVQSHAEGTAVSAPEISFPASRNDERLAKVEQEVSALRAELDDLKRRLGG